VYDAFGNDVFTEPRSFKNQLQINIDKLLKDVDGLCGFDLFYGCVVEMSPKHRTFSIYDPTQYKSMAIAKKLKWQVHVHSKL
jgi:hypothetical protein